MRKWGLLPLVIALATVTSGCWSAPKFKWSRARQIQAGMTAAEVTKLIGPPHSVVAVSENRQNRIWVSVEGFTYATKSLRVEFENGKVIAPPPIPDEFKD